jgi:hypothetical protein
MRPLHRGDAVAVGHLVELVDALGAVGGEGTVFGDRRVVAVAQQVRGAGVDLGRRDDAVEAAAGVLHAKQCEDAW